MQLLISFILFILNSRVIATQNAANQKLKKETTLVDKSDIEDTPSPEWIKYQQERFKNLDQLYSSYRKSSQPSLTKNPSLAKEELSKWQTTSRQDGSQNHQNKVLSVKTENSDDKESGETFEDETSSAVEFPSFKGFIKFIRSIKQTWAKNSLFRIEDKIKMLHQLKDSLLKTIENQFKILWQDDNDDEQQEDDDAAKGTAANEMSERNYGSHIRRKRGILDESNINFPPDAALISINFLTFAVFLIKLVLQVVNIVKTKHYQLSTMSLDTGAMMNG